MEEVTTTALTSPILFAVAGACMAVLLAGIGSALGIFLGGTKGAGVLAEKPHLFGGVLPLVALPGSQGFYGFLVAVFICLKAGILGGSTEILTREVGIQLLWAGCLIGLASIVTAWVQGLVVVASLGAVAREESLSVKAIVISALAETYAILALLIAIFMTQ